MSVAKKIRYLLIEKNMKIKDLAKKLNTGPSNISNKLSQDNFSEKEIREIAEALGCSYEIVFFMRDTGKEI